MQRPGQPPLGFSSCPPTFGRQDCNWKAGAGELTRTEIAARPACTLKRKWRHSHGSWLMRLSASCACTYTLEDKGQTPQFMMLEREQEQHSYTASAAVQNLCQGCLHEQY